MRISDFVTPETLITHFAEEFGAEKFMNKETAQKASKYIESEFQEWKGIVKEHPIQSAIAASGLLVGLSLRFSDQFSYSKVKKLFNRTLKNNIPSTEAVATKVLELSSSKTRTPSSKRRKSTKRSKKSA